MNRVIRLPILLVVVPAEQGKYILLCPRSRLRVWFRETVSAVPSPRVILLIILHTQAEFGAYLRDSIPLDTANNIII